ncbi:MAG: hypothetical protein AB7O67_02185 [Vicinamibacterales bacterium]
MDPACLCSDLVAGTHGRGFWILDNVTPLRQAVSAAAASDAYLFEPAVAVRTRNGMNDPTEWPPEVPHGDNPPPGGIIDYYLPADVAGPIRLEVLDAYGEPIRDYSSDDPVLTPDPALDPGAADKACQADPTGPNCRVPLYWPAPQMVVSTAKGMHRFSWDLRYEPLGEEPRVAGGATGAVPGRTYPPPVAPWAPPGRYTVRLTVNGRVFTQPLLLMLDPRVQTPQADLVRVAELTKEMYDGALADHVAYERARRLVAALEAAGGPDAAAFKAEVEAVAPAPAPQPAGGFRRAAPPSGPPTLNTASDAMMAAAMAMQAAETAPTARQVAACDEARTRSAEVMAAWSRLSTTGLLALNARRTAAGLAAITLP